MKDNAFFIYDAIKYDLLYNMKRLGFEKEKCCFYRHAELHNVGIFYFQANTKDGDRKIECSISIDKHEYEYYDELLAMFYYHKDCYFEISNYDHNMYKFTITFKRLLHTSGRIMSTAYSISNEGIKLLNVYVEDYRYTPLSKVEIDYIEADVGCVYEAYYKDIYRKIADDRALKNKEVRTQMDNVSHYISTESYLGGFNPLRDITINEIREQLRLPVCKELPTFKFNNSGGHVPALLKPPIFNPPATICYWNDGTKTVVKCQKGDKYSPEAGLALCYMKKILGNTSKDLNKELHKYIPEEKHADKKKNIKTKKVKNNKTKKKEEK